MSFLAGIAATIARARDNAKVTKLSKECSVLLTIPGVVGFNVTTPGLGGEPEVTVIISRQRSSRHLRPEQLGRRQRFVEMCAAALPKGTKFHVVVE